MSRRLAARVRLRQMRDDHQSSAWQHLGIALVLLAIGLGGPLVDLWMGDDPQPEDCQIADQPWISEEHRMPCEAWGMCND